MKFHLIFILFLIPVLGISQRASKENSAQNNMDQIKSIEAAKEVLRSGAILVRLETKQNTIHLLDSIGKTKEAELIKEKLKQFNLGVVEAFISGFEICPTYFFYSDESQKVVDGKIDEISFLDENLQPNESIVFTQNDYLIAEFGNIEQAEDKHFSDEIMKTDKDGVTKEKVYYGATNFGFPALVIRDKNLVQMRKPFPYYVWTYSSLPLERSKLKTVKIMNNKLKAFL